MFTSRAEHRLILREDNADQRLTPEARKMGLVSDINWSNFEKKLLMIEKEKNRLKGIKIDRRDLPNSETTAKNKKAEKISALEALRRPEVNYQELCLQLGIEEAEEKVSLDVVTQEKYSGYISRQNKEIKKVQKNENALIPESISYKEIKGLSNESKQKLTQVKPRTLAHAQRIPGMTPAAISLLLVHLKKASNSNEINVDKEVSKRI
jgi:tRNA uridine 5-carboxymethylaminomethyl modification enzyme